MTKKIDTNRIENAVKEILIALGDDPNREGIIETPKRVANMYKEVFEGMNYTNSEIAKMFGKTFKVDNNEMVVEKNISTFSYCEHHLALMYNMNVSLAYIPNGKAIGLSKIVRIVDMVSRRLQIQEKLTKDIAEVLMEACETDSVAVIVSGEHACMTTRGIKKNGEKTVTAYYSGKFKNDSLLKKDFIYYLNINN